LDATFGPQAVKKNTLTTTIARRTRDFFIWYLQIMLEFSVA